MMRLIAILKIALRALHRNKMRSTLTALGIIIGVGAVIAMVAIGNGVRATIEAQIASLGQNIIQVTPGSANTGGLRMGGGSGNSLTIEDAWAIRDEILGVAAISPEVSRGRTISAGNQNWTTQVQGQSEGYFSIREWQIAEGSFFTDTDVDSSAKVAVIGSTVADVLFPAEDAVGKILRVRNTPFNIVGVLARKGASLSGQDQDDVVIIPITAMRFVQGGIWINRINVQASSGDNVPLVKEEIMALLRQRHRIEPDRDDDFTVRTQEEIAAFATQNSRTMTVLLACIAGVSLVVGGIGIMNIMLVSVTERTREIGTRIAVGARAHDIMTQFLVEAVMLSMLGGVLGILFGVGASQLLSRLNGWPVLVSTTAMTIAVAFSAAVGVFFGFYPARKAARLDPIEALRFE